MKYAIIVCDRLIRPSLYSIYYTNLYLCFKLVLWLHSEKTVFRTFFYKLDVLSIHNHLVTQNHCFIYHILLHISIFLTTFQIFTKKIVLGFGSWYKINMQITFFFYSGYWRGSRLANWCGQIIYESSSSMGISYKSWKFTDPVTIISRFVQGKNTIFFWWCNFFPISKGDNLNALSCFLFVNHHRFLTCYSGMVRNIYLKCFLYKILVACVLSCSIKRDSGW